MATPHDLAGAIDLEASRARQQVPDWMEKAARIGYLAKGVNYLIVGGLAAAAAVGAGGRLTGSKGAFQAILAQPFGRFLLGVLALGLAAYAAWRAIQAVYDPDRHESRGKAFFARSYAAGSAVLHAGLVIFALRAAGWLGGSGGSGGSEAWTAKLLSEAWGRWIVAAAGLVVLGIAARQFHRAWTRSFRDKLRLGELSSRARDLFVRSAQWALTARGIVFTVIGLFFVGAAWRHDADQAGGLAEAMRTLQRQPFGPWLLAFVALGLLFYGVYQLVKARYRRIPA